MKLRLNEEYLGFPAGTIIENTSLTPNPQFMGKVSVLDLNDTPALATLTNAELRATPIPVVSDVLRTFDLMITRPANIDPYLAGDVISGGTLAKFTDVARAAGYGVIITNIRAQTDDTGLAGKTININIYNDTVTNQVDNSVYSVSDPAKRVGFIPITFGTGSRASVGADMFTNMMLNPVTRDIHVIVETVDAFTPSAVSTNIRIFMECILTN